MKLSIIGTSKIIEEHIKVAIANNIKIFGISNLKKKSINLKLLSKKYNIKIFYNWKKLLIESNKDNECHFLLAPRIQDTPKVLLECSKYNRKILVEKPIADSSNKILKVRNKENIFVGYNRIFYENVKYFKYMVKKNKKHFININCPEENYKNIILNSCHIISILYFWYKDLKIKKIIKSKGILIAHLIGKYVYININFAFKTLNNFSIDIFLNNKKYSFLPIEELKIYNKMVVKNLNRKKKFLLNSNKMILASKDKNFKDGFYLQMKNFKKFCLEKKDVQYVNFDDAIKILKICEKIKG